MSNAASMRRSRQLLSIVIVFFWASEYCHVPYFTPYLTSLGFGATAIGVMAGTYGLTQTFIRIPLGIGTDLTGGYRQMVIMGAAFTTISSFGLMFATSAWFIIVCRFLAGVAASTWLAFSVLYSAYYDPSEGVQAMTNINVFNNGGKLLAFVLGTITATLWGYKVPLLMSVITGAVAVVFALQLMDVPIKKEPMKLTTLGRTFCNPGVLLPAFFAIILQMVMQGTTFSFTSTVAELLGASRMQIGINTALFTVVQVAAGGWLGKNVTPKLGTTRAVAMGFVCLAVSCAMVAAAPNVYVLFGAQIVGGIGNILLMSILMALAIRTVPVENKSTAMGLFQALYGIGMTAGPVLIGRLVEIWNYQRAYMVFAGICVLTVVLAIITLPMIEKRARA